MRCFAALLLFFILPPALICAQETPASGVKQKPPLFHIIKDIPYQDTEPSERADLYLPAGAPPARPLPVVIWMHGSDHDKADARERNVCSHLASAGFAAISINYGTWPASDVGEEHSPRILQNIANARNAIRFFRAHAKDYNLDPGKIALFGGSAGAWLALMAGLTDGDAAFDSSPPYPGVSSSVSVIGDFYSDIDPWLLSRINAKSPPVLIFQGETDPAVDYHDSIKLSEALSAKGVANELHLLKNVGHSFDLTTWRNKPLPQDLRPIVFAFLRQHLVLASPDKGTNQ